MRILNFGSLNIDYVYRVDHFARPGETLTTDSLQINCGGKGLNQSVALAKAGVEVYHAGLIGPEGAFLKDKLAASGVNTTFVKAVDGSTGHAIIQVDRDGQNSILLHDGANGRLKEAYVDEVLSDFHTGDIVLLQNETTCVGYIMEQAVARGMQVALNAAPANEKLSGLPLEKLTWLLVNEVEGAFLTGAEEPKEIVQALIDRYPDTMLVLTLGVQGAVAARGERQIWVPARTVQAVDTTAAGDTFTGYFLRSVLSGGTVRDALMLATAASALAVTRAGASDTIPNYEETLAFMDGRAP